MGSSSSKFKKYLHHGDEFAAMQVFQSSPELQKNLNPNLSYGEHHNHDTALHFAAKHGMKHLLRTFLSDLGGNPNKKNGSNETSLHAACQLTNNKSFSAMERRAACVTFILQWKGAPIESGGREKIDLCAQDQNGNTALHVAAASGLEHCVQTLINAGSPLFVENNDKMTPCDMAVKNGYHNIAQLLESKMVFGDSLDLHNEDGLSQNISETDEVYCGLRTQDLQEAKDQLLVETSDMLQVPLFTAEALLRDNEWSREILLDKWMKDAVSCCRLAGVEPPESAFNHGEVTLDSVPSIPQELQDNICDICMLSVKENDQPSIKISCNHNFCFQCWETYLSNKIMEGMQHNILCPSFDCHILVPIDVIERLVSPDLAKRYLQFDIKAFVESNKSIKWCPVAGCGRAVRLPEMEQAQPTDDLKYLPYGKPPPLTSHAVDCGNGHFFCWECLGEAHSPSGCTQWKQWLDKVNQVRPEQLSNDMKDLEDASNCLWLVSNSKPCPNCKSPIQKNEGCNHIKCSKCKYDFCWICLEAWKKHSSATGGYFRCNRFPAASKADEKQGMLISEAVARSQQIQELNRFLHYYTRFKNHEHSRKLEESLLTAVKHKMDVLASSLASRKEVLSGREKNCTKFIEDGVRELLKARRVLCGSYVHGFYLEDRGYNKSIFEFMQNELETVTEKLSEMIARPYLKTPRHTIMQTTSLSRRKRHEFVRAVSKGLIPPETPPSFRKRKLRFPGLFVMNSAGEADMSRMIVTNLKSLDSNNTWAKEDQSRNSNISAVYEWPEFDSEEETEVSRALAVSLVGECIREGCNRPKARNPRTQALHDYCSLRCARKGILQSVTSDDSMDLIIALEMSRLQMIEDTIKRENQSSSKPNTSVSVTQTESDGDFGKSDELSTGQQKSDVGVTTEEESVREKSVDYYRRTNEDLAVDYFLKTLAGKNLQDLGRISGNAISPDKSYEDKDLALFRPYPTEDGRFEIGDIHETCFHQEEKDEQCLRRVRSTGDLCRKDEKKDQFREESRYHLDSDHSSQHDDKPEDSARRILALPGNATKAAGRQRLNLQEPCESPGAVDPGPETPAKDSVEADLEVCGTLSSSSETKRTSAKNKFVSFEMNSDDFDKSSDESNRCLQPIPNPAVKQSNVKKLRKSGEEKISSGTENSPSRTLAAAAAAAAAAADSVARERSESIKSLIEEVRNRLKSIEGNRFEIPREGFPSPIRFESGMANEFLRRCPERASTGKIKKTDFFFLDGQSTSSCSSSSGAAAAAKSATALENLISGEIRRDSSKFLFSGSEKNLYEAHKKAFKAAGGKIFSGGGNNNSNNNSGGGSGSRKESKSIHHSPKESSAKFNSNLRLFRTGKSPTGTDSSNEYETDTGIPKSPTLFISGVSISRTPEPCSSATSNGVGERPSPKLSPVLRNLTRLKSQNNSSPILNLIPASVEFKDGDGCGRPEAEAEGMDEKFLNFGRQSRSSSLTVPKSEKDSMRKKLNFSCGAILSSSRKGSCQILNSAAASSSPCPSPAKFGAPVGGREKEGNGEKGSDVSKECIFDFSGLSGARVESVRDRFLNSFPGNSDSQEMTASKEIHPRSGSVELDPAKKNGKSKSASEPEREREMFRFPKSSTDGALSSVLHVQESNLSSDDFHEVLFLLERSPKHGSKRKKKSKKERDKAKENHSTKDKCPEVSSAL